LRYPPTYIPSEYRYGKGRERKAITVVRLRNRPAQRILLRMDSITLEGGVELERRGDLSDEKEKGLKMKKAAGAWVGVSEEADMPKSCFDFDAFKGKVALSPLKRKGGCEGKGGGNRD